MVKMRMSLKVEVRLRERRRKEVKKDWTCWRMSPSATGFYTAGSMVPATYEPVETLWPVRGYRSLVGWQSSSLLSCATQIQRQCSSWDPENNKPSSAILDCHALDLTSSINVTITDLDPVGNGKKEPTQHKRTTQSHSQNRRQSTRSSFHP